jgi:inner membrane protein
MDPVTHGLIGASAAQSFAKKEKLHFAALVGAVSAMLPDLDILIDNASDPLLQLEFHRQFTHAFFFIPVGALITACLLWWFIKYKLTFRDTYFFSLIGMATAGLADTITSYGVQLFWPFADTRFAWSLISVFDPLFSLGIGIAVATAFYKKECIFARAAFGWMVLYLLFGWAQQQKAKSVVQELANQRNHEIKQLSVKPTIANELLWSTRYVSSDTLYADGVRLLPFAKPDIYEGESVALLNWQQQYSDLHGTILYNDIARFNELSNGILVAHPDFNQVIGDGRYAMLPTSIKPLWGIKIDTTNPRQHVKFNTYRDANSKIRTTFKRMLLGDNNLISQD